MTGVVTAVLLVLVVGKAAALYCFLVAAFDLAWEREHDRRSRRRCSVT